MGVERVAFLYVSKPGHFCILWNAQVQICNWLSNCFEITPIVYSPGLFVKSEVTMDIVSCLLRYPWRTLTALAIPAQTSNQPPNPPRAYPPPWPFLI